MTAPPPAITHATSVEMLAALYEARFALAAIQARGPDQLKQMKALLAVRAAIALAEAELA
jgi:hypothetical protein